MIDKYYEYVVVHILRYQMKGMGHAADDVW